MIMLRMYTLSPSNTSVNQATSIQVLSTIGKVSNKQPTKPVNCLHKMAAHRTRPQFWLVGQALSNGAIIQTFLIRVVVTVSKATIAVIVYKQQVECLQACHKVINLVAVRLMYKRRNQQASYKRPVETTTLQLSTLSLALAWPSLNTLITRLESSQHQRAVRLACLRHSS